MSVNQAEGSADCRVEWMLAGRSALGHQAAAASSRVSKGWQRRAGGVV